MGTILYAGGAAFRVWAPFAESVAAAGTFNQWSDTANPLASEGNGYWSADVPGAKVGDEYQFVIRHGTQVLWHKNPYASAVVNSSGNAIIHDPNFDWTGDDFSMPPWNELVIYEMHVGTFNDAPGEGPGTFEEILPKLPYLRDLGINAIEIMPVLEFPMSESWGYNPAQPFSVEAALGGPQGLQRFVKEAHAHGIAVIMDVVYNHFGPGDLDLWRFDGWSDEDHNGGIYFYDNSRSHTDWGDTRPDYGRPEVRQYLRDNALFWLNKFRADGLRFDSVINIRAVQGRDLPDGWSLLQWINNEIRDTQPWKITIAEDLQKNEWITKDTGAGGAGFGSQWDAGFVHPIREAIIAMNDADRNLFAVRDALYKGYDGDAARRVIYTESHDEVANGHARVPEEIWPGNAGSWFSRKRSTLGAALVFTAPGIPMIFQGQEFLEDEYFRDSAPLDWAKLDEYPGIHLLYRDLIRLRRNWNNQTRGLRGQHVNVHHVNNGDKVLGFHRWAGGGPGDDVIVVANFGDRTYDSYTLGFPRPGAWRVRFNSDWQGYSGDFGNCPGYDTVAGEGSWDGLPYHGNVGLGPYSVLILSQDR
ncbi:MAG TPA: 1,4-alpha-glucan branching protein [Verrucomicrobiales bacterium]|nr:1,4-alpha-glucan branching protein [Verrucomicrobiales bacterium]